MGSGERENRGLQGRGKLWAPGNPEHWESQHRRTGKPWASGNGKTVGTRKPGPPGSCSTGKLGTRGLWRAAASGNREYKGARKSWAQENQEDRAPLAQGNREQRAAENWEHWAATAPGNRSTGELGALDRCSTRELGAPRSPSGTGASCQARHWVWGPAPGHGRAWGGSGWVRGPEGPQ